MNALHEAPASAARPAYGASVAAVAGDLAWHLLKLAARSAGVPLAAVAVVVAGTLALAGSSLAGLPGAVAAAWFALHQVEVAIDDVHLGFLPLTPTLLVFVWTARCVGALARQSAVGLPAVIVVGGAATAPVVVSAAAMVVIHSTSAALELAMPNVLTGMGSVVALHGAAAAVGVGLARRPWLGARRPVPTWAWRVPAAAARASAVLLACSAAVTVLLVAASLDGFGDALARYDVAGSLAVLLVVLLYVPNVVVACLGFVVGAKVEVGDAAFGVAGVTPGPLPELPLFSGLPGGPAQVYWLLLLACPAAAGVLLGRFAHRGTASREHALAVVAAAALVVGTGAGALALAGGGALGAYGVVRVPVGAMFAMVLLWLAGVGTATVLLLAWGQSRRALRERRADVERAIAEAKSEAAAAAPPGRRRKPEPADKPAPAKPEGSADAQDPHKPAADVSADTPDTADGT